VNVMNNSSARKNTQPKVNKRPSARTTSRSGNTKNINKSNKKKMENETPKQAAR